MKVVMVDDSEADRRLCRALLEEALGTRLDFREANAARTGLETCREIAPDCILVNYKLPDMTGLEFLAQLRANEPGDAPISAVVMLAGLDDEQLAANAMKAGAQEYLVKERITAERLLATIEEAVEKLRLIRTLKQERDRLAQSLEEKEILLNEVHHRVKNNLQVIASLLRLQANSSHEPAIVEALRESQNRVESMALIHEQLYENHDLRVVDLARHAALLMANMFHSYGVDRGRISGRVDMEPLAMGVDRAIPAGLILTELISNALRHGFPGGRAGSIRVEGGRCDGRVMLAVRDDGVGFPGDIEPRRAGSLGLEIVDILTRQLKGAFELERSGGATFRISFPDLP
jgi:two-component sensor histidine kinase/CheY-like chemotaxis protein